MNPKIVLLCIISSASFIVGLLGSPKNINRAPSSSTTVSQNDYALLPCPSLEQAQQLMAKVHLVAEGAKSWKCDDSHLTKLLKVLTLAQKIKINAPENWGGAHQETLRSPLDYISKMTPLLTIDLHQQQTIAANQHGKEILIGSIFFDLPPLIALSVLIHESRHSAIEIDPAHEKCRTGDIFKTTGGCDQEFSLQKNAGAYSYGFVFNIGLALYGENLSDEDREFLLDSAIAGITTRFNFVPETLALPLDILYILKDDGKIYQVHPFTFSEREIAVPQLSQSESITHIRYDPIDSGILLFTSLGRVLSINHKNKITPYYEKILPDDIHIIDSTKIYLAAADYAYTFFATQAGDLLYKDIDLQSGQAVLLNFRKRPEFLTKKLFSADGLSSFALSVDGVIYRIMSATKGKVPKYFIAEDHLQLENLKIIDGIGNASYDGLYAVASNGKIYTEGYDPLQKKRGLIKSQFVADVPLLKYQDGLNVSMSLSENGDLYAWDYVRGTNKPWKVPNQNIKDFAIGRLYSIDESLRRPAKVKSPWTQTCQIQIAYIDPWTQKNMGITSKGKLVFEGTNEDPCDEFSSVHNFNATGIKLTGSELFSAFNFFSQTSLELETTYSQKLKIHPYQTESPSENSD